MLIQLFLAVAVTVMLMPSAPQSANANTATSIATLAETTQWIQTHFVGLGNQLLDTMIDYDVKRKPPKEKRRRTEVTVETVKSAQFSGCSMTVVVIQKSSLDTVFFNTYRVPLDRAESVTWKAVDQKPVVSPTGDWETIPSPAQVTQLVIVAPITLNLSIPDGTINRTVSTPVFAYTIEDQEMGSRLAKALDHAATLCRARAKAEPF